MSNDAARGGKIGVAGRERFGRRLQTLLFETLVTGQIGKSAYSKLRRCQTRQAAAFKARTHQAFGKGSGPTDNDRFERCFRGVGQKLGRTRRGVGCCRREGDHDTVNVVVVETSRECLREKFCVGVGCNRQRIGGAEVGTAYF